MQELFYRALHAVEEGLGARREYLRKDGTTLEGGPDHYARLTATKHLRDFMSLGRPKPKWEPKKRQGMMTYEELCAITDGRMPADENE